MSVSGSRAADEINLDEFERRLRAAGAQQARAEDPLAELARLVEFSHMGISNGETPARRAAEPAAARAEPSTSIENEALRPTLDDEVEELAPGASEAERAARQDYEFDAHHSDGASAAEPARGAPADALEGRGFRAGACGRRDDRRCLRAQGRGAGPAKKDPPFIAAAQGPTKVAPPSDETVAASNDAGASLLKDNAKPAPGQSRQFRGAAGRSERAGVAQQSAPAFRRCQSAAAADQAAPPSAADPTRSPPPSIRRLSRRPARRRRAMTSEFPDPKPVRTVSLRPDGTPIARPILPISRQAMRSRPRAAGGSAGQARAPRAEDGERRGRRRAAFDAQA